MDASEITEVCRLCPSSVESQDLLNVFSKNISFKYNIREVILLITGIEILENDLVSKKICQRCCNISLKLFEFRLDALKQDRNLKEKCRQFLENKGLRLPNTCITIKKESSSPLIRKVKMEPVVSESSTSKEELKKRFHPSIADIFRNNPSLKLPKSCFEQHLSPVVSLTMGDVETYFRKRKLDMKKFIYKPNLKIQSFNKVARKKTSFPTKVRTVAPLKISKKLFGNYGQPKTNSDYTSISTSVPKKHKKRNRIIFSSESEENEESNLSQNNRAVKKRTISSDSSRCLESNISRNAEDRSLLVPTSIVETHKPTLSKPKLVTMQPPVVNLSNSDHKTHQPGKTPSPRPHEPLIEESRLPSPVPSDPISEDSRDSFSKNISDNIDKPEFSESVGLTPTVTTTKCHTLLVCNQCGSVHHNSFELKRHTRKHMVCQFCKRRFKSIDGKQNHVDNLCEVKKIMNSPGPIVALEKLHLNLDVRKKYKEAFADFESIPGLVEPTPVEHVILQAASPPPPLAADDIIVLSDEDDESSARSMDPLSGIPTPSANMPSPAIENVVYNTVSIVRPDINIKNNAILGNLAENITEKQLVKDLIVVLRPQRPTTDEKIIQTDLPTSKDIKINHSEGTCEFKELRRHLATYKIPITISNGSFHVSYKKDNCKTNKDLDLWDDLPVINVWNKSARISENENKMTRLNSSVSKCQSSEVPLATENSHIPSRNVATSLPIEPVPISAEASSKPLPSTGNTSVDPTLRAVKSSTCLINVQNPVCTVTEGIPANRSKTNATIISINNSNSATPLLQTYALSITPAPVISKPTPIPRTYVNSALNNTPSNSNRNMIYLSGSNFSRPFGIPLCSSRSQSTNTLTFNRPINIINSPGPPTIPLVVSAGLTQQSANSNVLNIPHIPTTNAISQPINKPSESVTTPSTSEPSRFRVKNVWELQ